ncbi:hypothetical protein Tco_0446289 [Tanacetum coccineum]
MASVSNTVFKLILIHDDESSNDTPKTIVARKFLNEVKDTIMTLQRVVKSKMSLNEVMHPRSAAECDVSHYKSLAKEDDESLKKIKCLEQENEHLLRAVVIQDIMSIVQDHSVLDTSNLQTELERTKEKLKTCIIKKEMNMLLFGINGTKNVLSLEKENERLKLVYQNLFDFIKQTRNQTNLKTNSLQGKLNDKIFENAKLRVQLQDKFSEQNVTVEGMFRISSLNDKHYRVDVSVPNKPVKPSVRTKPICHTPKIAAEDNRGVESTTRSRRPHPRSNTKDDRVPSASKSSCIKNNEVEV